MRLPKVIPARGMIIPGLVIAAAAIFIYNNVGFVQKALGPMRKAS